MACSGNHTEHCCWIAGEPCVFLEENTVENRHWVCGLRRELGSWDTVHEDPRYIDLIRPTFEHLAPEYNCGDWPPPGFRCESCGEVG